MTNSSSQQTCQTKPKYRLQELENGLKHGAAKYLLEKLPEFGVSAKSYKRHKDIQLGSTQTISQRILDIYSKLFGVPINELYTVQPSTKTIEELYQEEHEEPKSKWESTFKLG